MYTTKHITDQLICKYHSRYPYFIYIYPLTFNHSYIQIVEADDTSISGHEGCWDLKARMSNLLRLQSLFSLTTRPTPDHAQLLMRSERMESDLQNAVAEWSLIYDKDGEYAEEAAGYAIFNDRMYSPIW